MKLNFHGYRINNLSYRLDEKNKEKERERVRFSTNKLLMVYKEKKKVVNLIVDISVDTKKGESAASEFRQLKMKIVFAFDLVFEDAEKENEKEMVSLVKEDGVSVAYSIIKDVIKRITSIDYTPPINIRSIDFPITNNNTKKNN